MERCSKDMAFACSACMWETNVRAVEKAVREEREAVVRWLRANENTYWANRNYSGAADNIERGEHRR